MDAEIIIRSVLTIPAIIGVAKLIHDITIGKGTRLRDEYKFAKEFLTDAKRSDIHPYALEKGYQAIAGSHIVKAEEIEYILSLKDPAQCLRDYVLSKQLMEHIKTKGDLQLQFKPKYLSAWSRFWRKSFYLLGYFIFAFLALSPFIIQAFFKTSYSNMGVQLLLSIPVAGLYAWGAINNFIKIRK